nr:hypothetical protein GCM10025730_55500 [Promicromonospora thailandica]
MVEKQGTDTVDVVTVGGGAATEPDAAPAVVTDPRSRRAILLTVSIALMAVVASVSGLNVAQPHLAATFDAAQERCCGSSTSTRSPWLHSSSRSVRRVTGGAADPSSCSGW